MDLEVKKLDVDFEVIYPNLTQLAQDINQAKLNGASKATIQFMQQRFDKLIKK